MLERLLRLAAISLSLLVAGGWLLFAIGETDAAAQASAIQVAGQDATRQPDPSPDEESARERAHGTAREVIDDINDVLLKPFAWVADDSASKWVRRSVPALLALVAYGFGLGFLSRLRRAGD